LGYSLIILAYKYALALALIKALRPADYIPQRVSS
jgi:hypothetical protein